MTRLDGDRDRDDPYDWVREESRDALRVNEMQRYTSCTHRYRPNHRGGGTCDYCGDEIYRDEL